MLNVICVKHGTKYTGLHVNRLYSMVKRHLTIPYRFVCFTENSANIDPNVQIIKLPTELPISGWWWKTYIFNKDHFHAGDIQLYFDLDMVIIDNIDKLYQYMPGHFIGLQNLGRVFNKPDCLGSAVLRWSGNSYSRIWDKFIENPSVALQYPGGDQDWIWKHCNKQIKFFPKEWIMSYKWEVRNMSELIRFENRWVFKNTRDPEIHKDTAVLAFHGTPDMEDVKDKIIVENWQ